MALRALQGPTGGGAPVGGTGTTNTIPRWTGPSTLGDSVITQSGTLLGVNKAVPTSTIDVDGLQTNSSGTSASAPTGTLRLNFAGQPTPGYGASIVFSQQWFAGSPTNYVAVGQITGVKTAPGGSFGGGVALWYSNGGTGLVEGMRINDTGNVAIGTTTPATANSRLTVAGGFIVPAGGFGVYQAGDHLALSSGSGKNLHLRPNDGAVLAVNVGATSCDMSAVSGYGLKLPATPGNTDPNTLDCYADGGTANSGGVTWTPELRFGGATTGITYNFRAGRYTRIGNMIFAQAHITLSSKGTATGNATVAGLPTMSNTADLYAAASIGYLANLTIGAQATGLMFQNSSQVTLYKSVANANPTNMADTDFANNSVLIFTICYPVT